MSYLGISFLIWIWHSLGLEYFFCVFYTVISTDQTDFFIGPKTPLTNKTFFLGQKKYKKIHIFNTLGKHTEIYRDRYIEIYFVIPV